MEAIQVNHVFGAAAALGSALCWAISAILFRQIGERMRAIALNFAKGWIALLAMAAIVAAGAWSPVSELAWMWLAASGILGIVLGDTLYFLTLQRLGARLTLLVSSLIPVTAALASVVLLGERPTILAWLGSLMTVGGVTWVLWAQSRQQGGEMRWIGGLAMAAIFIGAEASGIVLSKIAVLDVPALQATFIRQAVATTCLTFWALAASQMLDWMKPARDRNIAVLLIIASLIGAFVGTFLSILALKLTYTAVAAALNSTSPLFVLPFAIWWLREKISASVFFGTLIAVAGIMVYFSSVF